MKKALTFLFISLNIQLFGQCFTKISAGYEHTAAIKADGTLFTFGSNKYGQLGDGTIVDKTIPTQVTGYTWKEITAGYRSTLAIKTDGTLWIWGGIGRNIPAQLGNEANWKSIVRKGNGALNHTAGIKTDGTLWTWGDNSYGQLGICGNNFDGTVPTQLGTATNWQSITKGEIHTMAIKTDGTLWAWGWNDSGQFGNGTSSGSCSPIQIGTSNNWQSISAGDNYNIALKTDGTLWLSGWNPYDEDGVYRQNLLIHQIGNDNNWQSISAGMRHNLAIKTDGTLWAWGLNDKGQLGDGTLTNRNAPIQIGTDTDWQTVSAGNFYSVAIKNDGSVYTWGNNSDGQLGDNTMTNNSVPAAILCPETIVLAVDNPTSVKAINVYPNPVKNFLNIESDHEISMLSIYDASGREIMVKSLKGTDGKIDVSNLSLGTYFIKIIGDNFVETKKMIKE